jgi:hypothetical protein
MVSTIQIFRGGWYWQCYLRGPFPGHTHITEREYGLCYIRCVTQACRSNPTAILDFQSWPASGYSLSSVLWYPISWNTAHLLLPTLGNAVSWERAKKAGWLLHFGEYCNWILFNCNSTCPSPGMFLHTPPPWITNPTPHATLPCGRNLTGKKWSRTIYHSCGEFCIFYLLKYLIGLCCAWHAIICHVPPSWVTTPCPMLPTPVASI